MRIKNTRFAAVKLLADTSTGCDLSFWIFDLADHVFFSGRAREQQPQGCKEYSTSHEWNEIGKHSDSIGKV